MMDKGYIKLHRKIMDWGWYDDAYVFKFFCHILFKANIADTAWNGIIVPRGAFVSSYSRLAEECHMSIKQIRGIVSKLIRTNEMAKSSTPNYTIFTILNYDKYQGAGQSKGQTKGIQTRERGANEGQQYKNNKNNKKIKEEGANAPDCPSGTLVEDPPPGVTFPPGITNMADYIAYLQE